MFFAQKPKGKTVLVLDFESGSVGVGLVRTEEGRRPRLFGVNRRTVPILSTLSSSTLAGKALYAARELFSHAAVVAARLRANRKLHPLGRVASLQVFLSPPWTHFENGWQHEAGVTQAIAEAATERFGYLPVDFHPMAKPLLSVARGLFGEDEMLISSITGEVSELLHMQGGAIGGRATIPHGHHLLLRTLRSHAGVSEEEARSLLRLKSTPHHEAFGSARTHFVSEFRDVARQLLHGSNTRSVVVVGGEQVGEWFARSLAEAPLSDIFPRGGVVRALRAQHLAPHVESVTGDVSLLLEALYADAALPQEARSY